jgi:ribonucleotide reductase beta subunit family protein with ferritin-like domain
MTEKLEYLDKLKNNMGEEMAEMMSEEITKVMNEQRNMETTYAKLITERGQLKGISNKHKLLDTVQQIQVSFTRPFQNQIYI